MPVPKVRAFTAAFLDFMRAEQAPLMKELEGWKAKWTDEMAATVKSACEKFKKTFVA